MKFKKKDKSQGNSHELKRIAEAVEKIVYLNEVQLKSAGVTVNYPKKEV